VELTFAKIFDTCRSFDINDNTNYRGDLYRMRKEVLLPIMEVYYGSWNVVDWMQLFYALTAYVAKVLRWTLISKSTLYFCASNEKWSLWFQHVFCVRKCRVRRSMVMYGRNDVWFYVLIIFDKSATMNGNIGILATFPIVAYLMKSSISRCISHSKMPNLERRYGLCKRCQSNRYWVRLPHKCHDSPIVDEWPQQWSNTEGRCLKRMRRCVLSKKTTSNKHLRIFKLD